LANLYRRYFDDAKCGRLAWDKQHLSMRDMQKILFEDPSRLAAVPLFLTERGTPMTSNLLRGHYWRPAPQRRCHSRAFAPDTALV
jgi:hypothetical protein